MTRTRTPQQGSFYNLITGVMLILTLGVLLAVGYLAFNAPTQGQQVSEQPTAFVPATASPTLPGPTMNATWTASPSATVTYTPSMTRTATEPPTATVTATATASQTPTITPTSPATSTPVPTATVDVTLTTNTPVPTATTAPATATSVVTLTLTPNPIIYQQRGSTSYTGQTYNGAPCTWIGTAGQVFNKSNQAVTGVTVHISNSSGIAYFGTSGSHTVYGASGWEQQLPNTGQWFVELRDASGTVISPRVTIDITANGCDTTTPKNLAIVNFELK